MENTLHELAGENSVNDLNTDRMSSASSYYNYGKYAMDIKDDNNVTDSQVTCGELDGYEARKNPEGCVTSDSKRSMFKYLDYDT